MSEPSASPSTDVCYLHPDRPALLRCSRCERPICGDDAIEAPVGYQCPECARGGVPARRLRDLALRPIVTQTAVASIAVLFVLTRTTSGALIQDFGLWPVGVGLGEVWRLVTSAFLHANLMHVGFNGLLLYQLGQMLEPTLGRGRFAALLFSGLAGGSFGVMSLAWLTAVTPLDSIPVLNLLLATSPSSLTIGASGAVFGLMGAAIVGLRHRGINPWQTSIGGLVLLNLVLTFVIPGISVGGHIGGLLLGMLAGRWLFVDREKARRATIQTVAVSVGLLGVSWWMAGQIVDALLLQLG